MWFRSLHLTGAVRVMAIPRSTGAQQAQANLQTAAIGQPRLAPHACGLGWVWEPATQPMVNGSLRIAPHVTRNRTGEIRILRNETLSPQNRSGARDRTGGRAPEYLSARQASDRDRSLFRCARQADRGDLPCGANPRRGGCDPRPTRLGLRCMCARSAIGGRRLCRDIARGGDPRRQSRDRLCLVSTSAISGAVPGSPRRTRFLQLSVY